MCLSWSKPGPAGIVEGGAPLSDGRVTAEVYRSGQVWYWVARRWGRDQWVVASAHGSAASEGGAKGAARALAEFWRDYTA